MDNKKVTAKKNSATIVIREISKGTVEIDVNFEPELDMENPKICAYLAMIGVQAINEEIARRSLS